MENNASGTSIWCNHCKDFTICARVPISQVSNESDKQHLYHPQHKDLSWFQRGRICSDCGNGFLTAEIGTEAIDELVQLRELIGRLKMQADTCRQELDSTAHTLYAFSNSLRELG